MSQSDTSPPAHSSELGASMRKARGTLTQTELADRLGWDKAGKTKVSKIESGRQIPDMDDIDAWAAAAGVGERLHAQWKTLAAEAESRRNDYRKRMRHGQQGIQKQYSDLAEKTSHFRFFDTVFLPRYLQIYDYSHLIISDFKDRYAEINDVDAATIERQSSVRHLYDANKAFDFILDEPMLRHSRIPASVMLPQLDRLTSVIGLRNVRLGIFPSLSRAVRVLPPSGFELFDDIGYIENAVTDDNKYLADDVERLEGWFADLQADSAYDNEARELINRAAAAIRAREGL